MLLNSDQVGPTSLFPLYTSEGNAVAVWPASKFTAEGSVEAHYIRFPKVPKWTYITLTNGQPVFDQSQLDYQDFEANQDDEAMLVYKILQLAGMSIRELEMYQIGQAEQQEAKITSHGVYNTTAG